MRPQGIRMLKFKRAALEICKQAKEFLSRWDEN
jgi:hypothetical protein